MFLRMEEEEKILYHVTQNSTWGPPPPPNASFSQCFKGCTCVGYTRRYMCAMRWQHAEVVEWIDPCSPSIADHLFLMPPSSFGKSEAFHIGKTSILKNHLVLVKYLIFNISHMLHIIFLSEVSNIDDKFTCNIFISLLVVSNVPLLLSSQQSYEGLPGPR